MAVYLTFTPNKKKKKKKMGGNVAKMVLPC